MEDISSTSSQFDLMKIHRFMSNYTAGSNGSSSNNQDNSIFLLDGRKITATKIKRDQIPSSKRNAILLSIPTAKLEYIKKNIQEFLKNGDPLFLGTSVLSENRCLVKFEIQNN